LVEPLDGAEDAFAREPSQDRHRELEEPEEEGHPDRLATGQAGRSAGHAHGHGEAVHGQRHGHPENDEEIHVSVSIKKVIISRLSHRKARGAVVAG
jgi:hypothetical protein